jgi:hypothetical protein
LRSPPFPKFSLPLENASERFKRFFLSASVR